VREGKKFLLSNFLVDSLFLRNPNKQKKKKKSLIEDKFCLYFSGIEIL